jgi:hypothetical protein
MKSRERHELFAESEIIFRSRWPGSKETRAQFVAQPSLNLLSNLRMNMTGFRPRFPTPHRKIIHHARSRIRFAIAWLRLDPCFGPERQVYCHGVREIHKPNPCENLDETYEARTGMPAEQACGNF